MHILVLVFIHVLRQAREYLRRISFDDLLSFMLIITSEIKQVCNPCHIYLQQLQGGHLLADTQCMGGVYLPLEWPHELCKREPLGTVERVSRDYLVVA